MIHTVKDLSVVNEADGLVAKSCLTLVTPWTVAYQAPLFMGFSGQEYWSGLSCPSPGDISDPYYTLIRYMISKYFLPFYKLAFHFLDNVL